MVDAARDEKIDSLISKHGPIAYARYWRVLETIAEQMDDTDRCEVTFSWTMWARITWASNHRQAASNLRALAEHSLINLSSTDLQATCSVPNLLKIRARKKPIGCTVSISTSVSTSSIDSSTEYKPKNLVIKKTVKPTRQAMEDPMPNFDLFWNEYPNKKAKTKAIQVWNRLHLSNGKFEIVMQALKAQKTSEQWTKDGGQFIPHPSTWLNQKRWEDQEPEKLESVDPLKLWAMEEDRKAGRL